MSELLLLVHWLHIVSGVLWAGGIAMLALVVWPLLLSRPAPEAKALYDALDSRVRRVLGASGGLAVLLGILRGTVFGPVRSLDAWYGTRYGWLMTIAFIVFIALGIFVSAAARRYDTRVWNGANWAPGAARFIWRQNTVILAALGLLLACMVMLRLGI